MKYLEKMPLRSPINGTLELTLRCNLKCKMCMFRHSDDENTQLLNNELTVEQWLSGAKGWGKWGNIDQRI